MPVSPTLDIYSVTVGMIAQNTLYVPLSAVTNAKTIETQALIDCGASGMFINQNFAQNFKIHSLTKPIKNYNLTLAEQLELDKFLEENLEKGYIWPSQSPMASPFFFVSKKDGKLWPCQDYRYINEWTIKNSYPLPLISDILDKLKGAKYFTKLDVQWGYNNIRIHKGDEWKVTFKTNKGLFEPTVMFFSMCNSPVTFQAMIDDIFVEMINEKLVIIYMDNILIFAKTKKELERITKMVLAKLCEHNLFLKAKKCKFCYK